jgi:hypothetical protein
MQAAVEQLRGTGDDRNAEEIAREAQAWTPPTIALFILLTDRLRQKSRRAVEVDGSEAALSISSSWWRIESRSTRPRRIRQINEQLEALNNLGDARLAT